MKLFAPLYYKNFNCIADKCEHSCCIGWEIDVDENTLEKYKRLKNSYGKVILDSIATDDVPHFKLGEGDRCPHLNEHGLCKIILSAGEDYLCNICREHPRFYNYTNIAEVGIGMSCPEAARVILSSPDYATTVHIGEVDAIADDVAFDGRAQREKIYEILRRSDLSYRERLDAIYREYAIPHLDNQLQSEKLASLEYLDPEHRKLFLKFSGNIRPCDKDAYLERFFAYTVYRHCTEALDPDDFCARLGFCLFCEQLFASLIALEDAHTLHEIARIASIISEEIEYSDDNTFTLTYQ